MSTKSEEVPGVSVPSTIRPGGVAAWIGSVLASVSLMTGGVMIFPEMRGDAYTGTQARERNKIVDARLREHEHDLLDRIDRLESQIAEDHDRRCAALRREIKAEYDAKLVRLEYGIRQDMPPDVWQARIIQLEWCAQNRDKECPIQLPMRK